MTKVNFREISVRTILSNGAEHNVTLWINKDRTVSLLGTIPHHAQIIIDQKFMDDLQKLFKAIQPEEG